MMQSLQQIIMTWLECCEIHWREQEIQRHFRIMRPDAVTDIDKYLRARGWLP